jgi:TolB protein
MNNMRFPIAIFIILILIGCNKDDSSTNSQLTGKIIGTITEGRTGSSIVGATITTNPATMTVTSNAYGGYSISNIAAGIYTVTAAKLNYLPSSVTVTAHSDTLVVANIVMNLH